MTDHSHSTGEANLVAIDIAKAWNVVLVQEINGAKRTFKVANNAADHNQLLLYLSSLSGRTRVALEPTGDFHRPLAFRLLQPGFEVVSISSVAQARFREARYGTWDKTDPKDARVILATLAQGLVQRITTRSSTVRTIGRSFRIRTIRSHWLELGFSIACCCITCHSTSRSSAVTGIPHDPSGSFVS